MCAYFSKGRQEGISEQSLNVVREWPCDGLGEELFWQRELQRQKFWGYEQVWWKRKQVWLDGVPNEGKSNGLKNGWRWNDTEVGSLRASLQRIWILIEPEGKLWGGERLRGVGAMTWCAFWKGCSACRVVRRRVWKQHSGERWGWWLWRSEERQDWDLFAGRANQS